MDGRARQRGCISPNRICAYITSRVHTIFHDGLTMNLRENLCKLCLRGEFGQDSRYSRVVFARLRSAYNRTHRRSSTLKIIVPLLVPDETK